MSAAYAAQQQQHQQQPQPPQSQQSLQQQQQQQRGGPGGPQNRPPSGPVGGPPGPSPAQIQKILDENCGLISTIQDYQNSGKMQECMSYQHALHKNLVYLATLADSTQNISQILPVSFFFFERLIFIG